MEQQGVPATRLRRLGPQKEVKEPERRVEPKDLGSQGHVRVKGDNLSAGGEGQQPQDDRMHEHAKHRKKAAP